MSFYQQLSALGASKRVLNWVDRDNIHKDAFLALTRDTFLQVRKMGVGSWGNILMLQTALGEGPKPEPLTFNPLSRAHLLAFAPLITFPLSARAAGALEAMGCRCLYEAMGISPRRLMDLPNMGVQSLAVINKLLASLHPDFYMGSTPFLIEPQSLSDILTSKGKAIHTAASTYLRHRITTQGAYTLEGILTWIVSRHHPGQVPYLDARLGLTDGVFRTLQAAGELGGVTRECVRQIEYKCMSLLSQYAPCLDIVTEVLASTREQLPMTVTQWQSHLQQQGYTALPNFPPETFNIILAHLGEAPIPVTRLGTDSWMGDEGTEFKDDITSLLRAAFHGSAGCAVLQDAGTIHQGVYSIPREAVLQVCRRRRFLICNHHQSLYLFRPENFYITATKKLLSVAKRASYARIKDRLLTHPRITHVPPFEPFMDLMRHTGIKVEGDICSMDDLRPEDCLSPVELEIYTFSQALPNVFKVNDLIAAVLQDIKVSAATLAQYLYYAPFIGRIPGTSYRYLLDRGPTTAEVEATILGDGHLPICSRIST
jgi:hypothetical protein